MGPCAKQTVICTIITPEGYRFYGSNSCLNPQKECPREPGEDYTKCSTICDQQGHAEEQALRAAGNHAKGARAYIEGHTWVCKNCQEKLFAAGVESIKVGPPPLERLVL
jgi:deoxycytidylate deaminase